MINLSKLFKKDPAVPAVAAVIVNKATDLDVAKKRMANAGFQVEKFDDSGDGIIVFPQSDTLSDITVGEGGVYIIKMDEMLSCIVTGIEKSFESINFDSTSFDEVLAQEGVRPGIHLSLDILSATVSNIFAKAEDRSAMVSDLSKALDEFKSHIVGMAQAVPENAFSIDFFKVEDFQSDKPADKPANKPALAEGTGETITTLQAVSENAGDGGSAGAAPSDNGGMGKVIGQMAELAKSIEALTQLSKGTAATIDAQNKRIDMVADLAKSAKSAVETTVRGGAGADPVPVEKGATLRTDPPLIDTAFNDPRRTVTVN